MLALVTAPEAPAWCHRHLARGDYVPATLTKTPIDLDTLVIAPDLCQQCLQDVDSWLRLFGLREEWEAAR